MMILTRLKTYTLALQQDAVIQDVRIGLSYTAVCLNNGSVGVAMTFRDDIPSGCLPADIPLIGKKAGELIENADSSNILQRTVALATINATLNTFRADLVNGDLLDILKPGKEDIVGMVGYFGPFVKPLQEKVKKLYIFEKSPAKAEGLYPAEEAQEILPRCSIAIITSTSLLNLTFETLADAAENCRKTVMTGGSTPFAPDLFKSYGVDMVSGLVIRDGDQVLRTVSESGGMRSFSKYADKVNLYC